MGKWALRCVVWAAVLGATLAQGAGAQGGPSGPPYIEPNPQTHGQWSGPWDLSVSMQNDASAMPYAPVVGEIAHSILVPPRAPELLSESPYRGWVVFMNRRGTGGSSSSPQPTFLWNPNDPATIDPAFHLMVPGGLDKDIFCSGHGYLPDGRPVTAGGQDTTVPPMGTPPGQSQSYVLNTITANPTDLPTWATYGPPNAVERWYPTLTTMGDGRLLQVGDSAQGSALPGVSCQTPLNDHDCGDFFRAVLDPAQLGGPAWGPEVINRLEGTDPQDCTNAAPLPISHYPRLHQLASGELMWADAITSNPKPVGGRNHLQPEASGRLLGPEPRGGVPPRGPLRSAGLPGLARHALPVA